MLFGAPIVGLWYWCTDQYMVQRCLAARNMTEARRGTIFAAYLKLLPLFIFIVPGMIAFALAKKTVLCSRGQVGPWPDAAQQLLETDDQAFPLLVTQVLPVGLRGLVVAACWRH